MGWFIISLGIILIGGGKLLGSTFGKKTEKYIFDHSNLEEDKPSKVIINNYTTEQHVHISEKTAQNFTKNE